jgi:hypothetical protein
MNRCRFVAVWAFLCFSLSLCAQAPPDANDGSFQPAAALDTQLPHWLKLGASYRSRFEDQAGLGFKNASDSHLLGRLWLDLTIHPTGWLTFFGQAQDSRMFFNDVLPSAAPNQNAWDLRQAWIQLGDDERHPISARFGRQELNFGEQRLVGSAAWLNSPRVFDAAVATLRFTCVRVDVFASSVVNPIDGQMDHHKQGNPFYGLYGSLTHVVPKASIEPYFFWRLAPAGYGPAYANGAKGHFDEKTVGFRWAGKLPSHFDYTAEMARQYGSLSVYGISAWAGHWTVGRTLDVKWQPRLFAEYNYASGTSRPDGNTIGTFDQLYPSGHGKLGETDQVGWRNICDLRAGAEFKPTKKIAFNGVYHNYWLANAHDALYAGSGAIVARSLAGAAGSHVGQELAAEGLYNWNKALQFGLGYGHLFTGQFLNRTTAGKDFNYPYVMAGYKF